MTLRLPGQFPYPKQTGSGGHQAARGDHTHTEADVSGLTTDLAGKAATTHTHAETDVTNLTTDLNAKLAKASNLSDVANTTTARTNIGAAAAVHTHVETDVTDLVTAWASWTPTWTAATTNPVLGNGTITARFKQVGKTVFFNLNLAAGSTTTFGSGGWAFSQPVAAEASVSTTFPAYIGIGAATFVGVGRIAGSTFAIVTNSGTVAATSPGTWASGSALRFAGVYEAA